MLLALNDFSPYMLLDGARFWWISDVLQRDVGILIVWVMMSLVQSLTHPQRQYGEGEVRGPQYTSFRLIICVGLAGIAWYWELPAYIASGYTVLVLKRIVVCS